MDDFIAAKIQTEAELEEETCNADTYQSTLEERIVLLTEFIQKAQQPLPRPSHPSPPVLMSATPVNRSSVSVSDPPTGDTLPMYVSSHPRASDTGSVCQNVTRLSKLTNTHFQW